MKKAIIGLLILAGLTAAQAKDALYRDISSEFHQAAKKLRVKKIAVFPFQNIDNISPKEIAYLDEKFTAYLQKKDNIEVADSSSVKKILEEKKFFLEGLSAAQKVRKISAYLGADAVVICNVYAGPEKIKLLSKFVDVKTSRVAAFFEGEEKRSWEFAMEPENINIPVPTKFVKPLEYRDAIRDFEEDPCAEATEELRKLQKETLGLKARYWASRLKSPDFSYSQLTSNPGSEFKDGYLKQEFYSLLKEHYYYSGSPALTGAEKKKAEEAMLLEKELAGKCDAGGAL